QVGTRETRGTACQYRRVDISSQRHLAHVHFQDLLTAADIGQGHDHLTVEATGAKQGRIQDVRAVGGSHHEYALAGLEAVHFDQQLVERLLAFIVPATQAGATLAADGVDFVDEDDARCLFLRVLEHVAHTGRTYAHEHFDEVRA